MARIARIIATGYPYHITQRGNYQQIVFEKKTDYITYLKWFEEYKNKYSLGILAYCLMPNHVHFIAVPKKGNSLSKTYACCSRRYSVYCNKNNDTTGHLWQNRFHSCILDERHLYAAIRYVENNPVYAKLVKEPHNWEFSSAAHHLHNVKGHLTLDNVNQFLNIKNWQDYLKEEINKHLVNNIKANSLTGRPSGDFEFIRSLESKFKVRLQKSKAGRKNLIGV